MKPFAQKLIACAAGCLVWLLPGLEASAQQRDLQRLFPVVVNEKWGFIDSSGKIVIAPRFDSVGEFHDGLARVTDHGRVVFVNETGVVALRPRFDVVDEFSEGLAAVNMGEERAPSIGIIIKPGKWGYIDKTGKLIIPLKFTHAEDFHEGVAGVKDGETGEFIDHKGNVLFNIPLDATTGFHEGVVAVILHGNLSYYDRAGKLIPTPPLDYGAKSSASSEGLVPINTLKKWGFVDKSGKLVIPAEFEDAEPFSEGLAAVEVLGPLKWCPPARDGSRQGSPKKYGYIDHGGKMIIQPQFDTAGPFSEGLAAVRTCSKTNFIDKTGTVVIAGDFDDANAFSGGLARVYVLQNSKLLIGYIDKTGHIIWKPTI